MRRLFGLSLFCSALLATAPAFAALQKGIIEAGKLKGQVTLKDASGRTGNLTTGATFKEGHFVETGANSSAELILSNGATILVSPETLIEFKVFAQVTSSLIVAGKYREMSEEPSPSVVQIDLHRGKITGEARKLNASTQFTVKTPVGLTRVRGTVWTDEYIYDTDTQLGTQTSTCIKGAIEVNDLEGNLPTPAVGGEQVIIVAPSQAPRNYLGDGKWDDNPPNLSGNQSQVTSGPAPSDFLQSLLNDAAWLVDETSPNLPQWLLDIPPFPSPLFDYLKWLSRWDDELQRRVNERNNLLRPRDPFDFIIEKGTLDNVSPSGG